MHIKIGHSYVSDFNFKQLEPQDGAPTFNLEVQSIFSTGENREFVTAFKLSLTEPKEFEIEATYCTVFTTDDDIDLTFMKSHFPSVNTPAIAYPFFRSVISMLTLNFGFTPVILPTINFTKFPNIHIFLDNKVLEKTLPNLPEASKEKKPKVISGKNKRDKHSY